MSPLPPWSGVAILDEAGACVAGLQHGLLRFVCDGERCAVAGLRNVAVAEHRRGEGLMRALMSPALAWCDANAGSTLLYAETPALYERFGFAPLPQHVFEGPAPAPVGHLSGRPFDVGEERGLLERLLVTRAPVSTVCGIIDDAGLTATKLGGDAGTVHFAPSLDALVVSETCGDTLVLIDIVAARMPAAARILGALGVRPTRLRTRFPPDRLEWHGDPVADDTGLMARGAVPAALRRPFILPPTVEF